MLVYQLVQNTDRLQRRRMVVYESILEKIKNNQLVQSAGLKYQVLPESNHMFHSFSNEA